MLKIEEHGQIIQSKYNQLVSNLSCLGDIIAMMYQKEKLTLKELEQIQHLQSTPIRANEELLSIIARKPRDVYECFLSLIKDTNQPHLYQILVSGDNSEYKALGLPMNLTLHNYKVIHSHLIEPNIATRLFLAVI